MSTRALTTSSELYPSVFNDFFRPWNELFGSSMLGRKPISIPAVNIAENKDNYTVSIAAPGLNKNDFEIDMEGNMLTVSCEKEETKEDKDSRHVCKEYNYSSFSRSFTLPENVNRENIGAVYADGVLMVTLPKKDEAKKAALAKHIEVQ
jgi:HSP20 family protein